MAQIVENLSTAQDTPVQSLGREDPLEKGLATPSSILVQVIPMDRGTWQATGHEVNKSQTWLTDIFTFLY